MVLVRAKRVPARGGCCAEIRVHQNGTPQIANAPGLLISLDQQCVHCNPPQHPRLAGWLPWLPLLRPV